MELHFEIIKERTVVVLRSREGHYSQMVFAAMPAEAALALLPQYGRSREEVVSLTQCSLSYPSSIDYLRLERFVLWAYEQGMAPTGRLTTEAVGEWIGGLLPLLLPAGARVERLPKRFVEYCYNIISQNGSKNGSRNGSRNGS